MKRFVLAAVTVSLFACDTQLAHQNPFDEETPKTLQAKVILEGRARLEGAAADATLVRRSCVRKNQSAVISGGLAI